MAHQATSALEPMTEDEEEEDEEEEKEKKKDREVRGDDEPNDNVEEQNDSNFEKDFLKQQQKAKKDAIPGSRAQDKPKWQEMLADYQHLNSLLKSLARVAQGRAVATTGIASLSMSDAPDHAYGASPEIVFENKPFKEVDWFRLVDKEMEKVSQKTNDEIQRVRRKLAECRENCERWNLDTKDKSQEKTGDQQTGERVRKMLTKLGVLESEAKQLGQDFLALEKFVNLNYQAFEKLLKNHDKLMPGTPCHQFYMTKLRHQSWIRTDFSDVFVTLSDCHSLLRQDDSGTANTDAKQDFVRNTKKYWVPTEHISSLKHLVLQHLPVFRMWTGGGDSQLVNSVYFDNRQMQLYHGRMDKNPGAIALRLRWYGTEIKTVYVERKTHLDAWTGNVSVKERFTLEERLTVPFLNGSYTVNEYADDMKRRGKKDADIQEACKLFSQIARVIESKQLGPTVRTQYMRTAFQIPFDSTVRISLDTNLAMVREDCCGYAATITERWRRDERIPVKASEHTHFPHAILEVKLQGDVENPPTWVKDMISSGMVTEVYKFSKFIHGSAVLLTELVGAAPYWIDDISIRDSVNASAPTASNNAKRTSIAFRDEKSKGVRRGGAQIPKEKK
jgi:SPX domain protein involved in polyphosphate accumulation